MLRICCPAFTSSVRSISSNQCLSTASTKKLVIFDKDGTLLAFDKPWLAWCTRLQTQLTDRTANIVHRDITNLLHGMGVDLQQRRIGLGAFAENSFTELQQDIRLAYQSSLENMLNDNALVPSIIASCREDSDANHPLTDIPKLFNQLRYQGYSIAIATADTADGVDQFLESVNTEVDFVMSASDPDYPPKPNKESAVKLCRHFGVDPQNVVMVGDTPTDMGFGVNGNFGLVVGVTSGVGGGHNLRESGAHVILDDLSELPSILE